MFAALLTIGFGLLAIPFLVLTTIFMLGGGVVATGTLLVFIAYGLGLVAVVLFWIRIRKVPRA